MECSLYCQICSTQFKRVFDLKRHLHSVEHQKKLKDIFPQDTWMKCGFLPRIVFVDPSKMHDFKKPVVGLSLITLCFSSLESMCFYLCHVCEQICPLDNILSHIFSHGHYSNYISYTYPNEVSFSWLISMDSEIQLSKLKQQRGKSGFPKLQMLHLPKQLMEKLSSRTYSEVMHTLSENDKLLGLFEAIQPKRKTIQAYQNDSNRKHPLLGLSPKPEELRRCLEGKTQLRLDFITKRLYSQLDPASDPVHVKDWRRLLPIWNFSFPCMQHLVECVGPGQMTYYLCTLCRLSVPTHMVIKHVLSFDHIYCYFKEWHPSTLLSKESYRDYKSFIPMILDFARQSEEIHGTTSVKQVRLEPREVRSVNLTCYAQALKDLESITKSSLTAVITPGSKLEYKAAKSQPASSMKTFKCKLRCQDCNIIFNHICDYLSHLSKWTHKTMLNKFFPEVASDVNNQKAKFHLGLLSYVKSLKRNKPAAGTSLVVTCVTTEAALEPIYLCFACLESFSDSSIEKHFESQQHLIKTLMYLNPWRLPFAWEGDLDEDLLRLLSFEEEEKRGCSHILKVFDVPYTVFWDLMPCDYKGVLKSLELHHTLLKREVPPRETFKKNQENEKFPLLGKQFLVMHDLIDEDGLQQVGSLCLLCERRLSVDEGQAHVFSREHVLTFLDRFHPGSLDSSPADADTLLDLAKQADCIHSVSNVQEIKLQKPIWEPCDYKKATSILASAKQRNGKGRLEPLIKPLKKLVPRGTQKEVDQNYVKDGQKKSNTAGKQESTQIKDKTDDVKETNDTREEETKGEMSQNMCPGKLRNPSETIQAVKVKTEKPETGTQTGGIRENCEVADKSDGAQAGTKGDFHKEEKKKRRSSASEKAPEDKSLDVDVGRERISKRQRLTSKDDSFSGKSRLMPISGISEEDAINGKLSNKKAKKKVSSAPAECRCVTRGSVYLCGSCQTIPEKDLNNQLTGRKHQKMLRGDVEIDKSGGSEDCATTADTSAKTDTAIKTACVPPKSNGHQTKTHVKVAKSADKSRTSSSVRRSNQEISSTTSACRPQGVSTETALKTTPSCKAASFPEPESPLLKETPCRIVRRAETACKASAAPRKKETSVTPAEMPKPAVKHGITGASAKTVIKSVGGDINVAPHERNRSTPATPQPSTVIPPKSEQHMPHKELSHISGSKTVQSGSQPKVGLNYLTLVLWGGKQQVYCLLCSARLNSSSNNHLISFDHQYNYVKSKYPEWTAKLPEKLNRAATLLDMIEEDLPHLRKVQRVEVEEEIYHELGGLMSEKATEMVKALVKKRGLHRAVCAVDAEQNTEDVSSPCEVSSSDDGKRVPHNVQPEQQNSNQRQTITVHTSELESNWREESNQVKCKSARSLSSDWEVTEAGDLIQDRLQSPMNSNESDLEVVPVPGMQAEDRIGVEEGEAPGCTDHLVKLHDRHQQWNSNPHSKDPPKEVDCRLTLSTKSCGSELQPAAANTEQQNQSGSSHKAEQAPERDLGEHSASQQQLRTSVGSKAQGCSHLSVYLKVNQYEKQVIGLESIWECHGMFRKTFFLCESCEETLSRYDIFEHLVSFDHQFKYIRKNYPMILQIFWLEEDLPTAVKMDILNNIVVLELSKRERFCKADAKCVFLGSELHEFIQTAPFSEALQIVQDIVSREQVSILHLPISPHQQKKTPSPLTLQMHQRSDSVLFKAGQEPEQCHLEEPVVFGDECSPSRKRTADTTAEILLRTRTDSPDPSAAEYILHPKRIKSEPSSPSISESCSFNPAAILTVPPLKGEDMGPYHLLPTVGGKLAETFDNLNMNPSTWVSDQAETFQEAESETDLCADDLAELTSFSLAAPLAPGWESLERHRQQLYAYTCSNTGRPENSHK